MKKFGVPDSSSELLSAAARVRPVFPALLAGSCCMLLAQPLLLNTAVAQEASRVRSNFLEEVVVTAQKREQSLQDVGLAINVLQGSELKDRRINSLADIAHAVPSLTFALSAENTPVYTLRGVSFYDTSIGGYGAVAIYIDQFPLPYPKLTGHSAFDLERVEVVKGPQGTLFGQNATGGAVNFIAAKPTDELAAGFEASYGRFNEVVTEGYVSGPISDTLRGRLAGRSQRADEWQRSNSRPGDETGKTDVYSIRALLDYEPADNLRFHLNLNGWRDKSDTAAAQYAALQGAALTPGLQEYREQLSPKNSRAADWTPGSIFSNNEMLQVGLRSDIDFTDTVTLTALTSYIDFSQSEGVDQDGLPIAIADHFRNIGSIYSFSQEVRLSNGGADGVRWVLGANLERSDVKQEIDTDYGDSNSNVALAPLGFPIYSNTYSSDQEFRNHAVFGNLEFDLSETVVLKGGLRYTDSRVDGRSCNRDDTGDPTNSGAFFYTILAGGAFGPYPDGACFVINDQGIPINGVAPGAPGEYAGTLAETNVSWMAGVDWKVLPDTLLYANISKGYKAGSFPTATGSYFTSYLPVAQESVLSYELGMKSTYLQGMVQLNASLFYYDYADKQLRAKTNAPPFGILDVLQNIPESSVKGAEFEVSVRPVAGLLLSGAYSYIDGTVDKFSGINGAGVAGDFSGTPLPFTPEHHLNFNSSYSFDITSGVSGFVGLGVTYRSDTISVVGGDTNAGVIFPADEGPVAKIDSYTLVDIYAGIGLYDDRLKLSVFGKNITDEYYWTNVFNTNSTVNRLAGRPATYGVSVSYAL